jgi:hypothetical protein
MIAVATVIATVVDDLIDRVMADPRSGRSSTAGIIRTACRSARQQIPVAAGISTFRRRMAFTMSLALLQK